MAIINGSTKQKCNSLVIKIIQSAGCKVDRESTLKHCRELIDVLTGKDGEQQKQQAQTPATAAKTAMKTKKRRRKKK